MNWSLAVPEIVLAIVALVALVFGVLRKPGTGHVATTAIVLAGFVAAAVGSLSRAEIRPAGRDAPLVLAEPLEIVSLSGTFSADGPHLHIAVADAAGRCCFGVSGSVGLLRGYRLFSFRCGFVARTDFFPFR